MHRVQNETLFILPTILIPRERLALPLFDVSRDLERWRIPTQALGFQPTLRELGINCQTHS